MKILKYSFLLSMIAVLTIACNRDSDIYPAVQEGVNVRLIKEASLPGFINAEDIPNSRIVINGFSENDNISRVELFMNYQGSAANTRVLLKTIQGSEISNGLLPAIEFTTQQLADAIPDFEISDIGAGDKIDIINVTTLTDGRVYPNPNNDEVLGIEISDFNQDGVPDTTFLTVNNLGASIAGASAASFTDQLTYFVACPFSADDAVGQYLLITDGFGGVSLDPTALIEVVKIDETTVRMVDVFKHPGMFDIDVVVDLPSGMATVVRQPAFDTGELDYPYGEARMDGSGFFLSCVGFVTLDLQVTVDLGSFGVFKFEFQKQ